MRVGVLDRIRQEAAVATHRVGGILVDLEEALGTRHFEDNCGLGRKGCELDVAIPLHRLVEAVEQHVDAGCVHLLDLRKVEHQLGPIGAKKRANFV